VGKKKGPKPIVRQKTLGVVLLALRESVKGGEVATDRVKNVNRRRLNEKILVLGGVAPNG